MPSAKRKPPKTWKGDKWKNPYLLNWPPERGPMPPWMRREPKFVVPTPSRKDGPAPPPPKKPTTEMLRDHKQAMAAINKKTIKWKPPKRFLRPAERVVAGQWNTDIHVATLAKLSLLDANRVVHLVTKVDTPRPKRPTHRRRSKAFKKWFLTHPKFPDRSPVRVTISYPMRRNVTLTIKPYRSQRGGDSLMIMSETYVLWTLAREYVRIYRKHKRYGVWGHSIGDLWFEGLHLLSDKKSNGAYEVDVDIGS